MGLWSVVVPESADVTNMVTNPSVEIDTTGYTAVGGSISQIASQQRRGTYGLQVSPTAGTADGVYFGTVSLTSGQTYTFSLDVKGVNGIPYRIYFGSTAGAVLGTPTTFTGTGDWQRVSVTYTESSTTTRRLYIVKNNSASTGAFYIDGLLCINLAYDHTYFDGEYRGVWNGQEHASTSVFEKSERLGGQVLDLETYGFYLSEFDGIGMPEIDHHMQKLALLPGALYKGSKIQPRFFLLTGEVIGSSLADYHSKRKDIIDAIKPDAKPNDQPFLLRYTGANSNKPVDIACNYYRGLGLRGPSSFAEKLALGLAAYDPNFYEDGDEGGTLYQWNSATFDYIAERKVSGKSSGSNTWAELSSGMNGAVKAIARHPDGSLYIGGSFTTAGGVTVNHIAKWDGTSFSALGSGPGVNGDVNAIVITPDGTVYLFGAFTAETGGGAGTLDRAASWNGSSYTELNTGLNGTVNAAVLGHNNWIYVTGAFSATGGATTLNRFAAWHVTAGSWQQLTDGTVGIGTTQGYALCVGLDGAIYVAGDFTTAGSISANRVAKWVQSTSTYSALGSGLSSTGRALAIAPSGYIFAGGDFTTAGGVTVNKIARWNGSAWVALGAGVTGGNVYSLAFDQDSLLWVGGTFTTAGALETATMVAIWNGATWAGADVKLAGGSTTNVILVYRDLVYLGFSGSISAFTSMITILNNTGSAAAYPIIMIRNNSGANDFTLRWLRNETNGKTIFFNYVAIDGEILALIFDYKDRKILSNIRGDVTGRAILRNSNFSDFHLLPGSNVLTMLSTVSAGVNTKPIYWHIRHWSVEGVAA